MKAIAKNSTQPFVCKGYIIALALGFICLTNALAQHPAKSAQPHAAKNERNVHRAYATVNGLNMYYEIHGSGQPLVLLHGAYMTIHSAFGKLIPALAKNRQVIAVELQGHGRTADIDRPITYEQMADDVAALLRHLRIPNTDVFGYSMGGGVALQMGIRHPDLVHKLVVASASYKTEGWYPELIQLIPAMTPEMFDGSPLKQEYDSLAPNKQDWPQLVAKLKQLDTTIQDWKPEAIRAIKAPTLLIIGDSDAIRPEHTVELFRLLGGGVMGDLAGLPNSQLAVLPGTTHVGVMERTDWLLAMIPPFLDAPIPAENVSTKR